MDRDLFKIDVAGLTLSFAFLMLVSSMPGASIPAVVGMAAMAAAFFFSALVTSGKVWRHGARLVVLSLMFASAGIAAVSLIAAVALALFGGA